MLLTSKRKGNFSTVSIPHVYYYDSNGDEALNITFQSSFLTYRAQMGSLNFEPKRPEIQCQVQNGDIVLGLADSYSAYLWTTDATTAEIVVGDTGWYHVYVPQGVGMLASQKVYVSDLTQGCDAVVSSQEAATGTIRPAKLIGLFDILGRPIFQAATGQLVIERYDNGQQRKVIYVE